MEDGTKAFVKEVKALPKGVKDESVFKGLDQSLKNFATSVPLVADLRSPAMRDRHWQQLMATTKACTPLLHCAIWGSAWSNEQLCTCKKADVWLT